MSSSIDKLKQKYETSRKYMLTHVEFTMILMSYPAILVSAADNRVSILEYILVNDTAIQQVKNYVNSDINTKDLEAFFLREIDFLVENIHDWEGQMLQGVKKLIETVPAFAKPIQELMQKTADVHHGTSDLEKRKIEAICNTLGLPLIN